MEDYSVVNGGEFNCIMLLDAAIGLQVSRTVSFSGYYCDWKILWGLHAMYYAPGSNALHVTERVRSWIRVTLSFTETKNEGSDDPEWGLRNFAFWEESNQGFRNFGNPVTGLIFVYVRTVVFRTPLKKTRSWSLNFAFCIYDATLFVCFLSHR